MEDRTEGQAKEPESVVPDNGRSLREMARRNQDLEATYGGEESLGQRKPMSLWERIQHAISVLASTEPTR